MPRTDPYASGRRRRARNPQKHLIGLVAAGVCAFAAPAYADEAFGDVFWQYTARAGFDFSSGHYGATKPTEILYLPVTLKAAKGPWTLRADVSWLHITGPALLLDAATADPSLGIRTSGSASGPGDIHLYGTYSLESLYDQGLFIDLTARVKIPTASFAKGLGTGAWDEGAQIDVAKTFGDFMPFAQLGYRFTGSPAGYQLRNIVYGSVGVQYTWTTSTAVGVSYDVRQAALRTAHTPQEATAYINYKLGPHWSVNVYGVAGFSQNSPDAGGGGMVTLRWP
jgi:hypothetical protein